MPVSSIGYGYVTVTLTDTGFVTLTVTENPEQRIANKGFYFTLLSIQSKYDLLPAAMGRAIISGTS